MTQKANAWRILWPWLLTLAIYAVIYWFSAQPSEISNIQSAAVRDWIGFPEWATTLVRKIAHVLLYVGLGAAACLAWLRCGRGDDGVRRAILRAVVLCAALAALDEFHQYFVPGRAALISDVILDTVSAALGAACLVKIAKQHTKNR